MKQIIINLICYLCFTSWLTAQNTISAWVADEEGKPIAYANVILLHSNDSITPIKGTLTNETGQFQFEKVPTILVALN